MTHDEILRLKAGRTLDAIVAEKVMGWTVDNRIGLSHVLCTVFKPNPLTSFWVEQAVVFNPSTDISAAWEVLEKMKETMEVSVYSDMNGKWACEVGYIVWDDYDTAPEAICKAALAAIESNEQPSEAAAE